MTSVFGASLSFKESVTALLETKFKYTEKFSKSDSQKTIKALETQIAEVLTMTNNLTDKEKKSFLKYAKEKAVDMGDNGLQYRHSESSQIKNRTVEGNVIGWWTKITLIKMKLDAMAVIFGTDPDITKVLAQANKELKELWTLDNILKITSKKAAGNLEKVKMYPSVQKNPTLEKEFKTLFLKSDKWKGKSIALINIAQKDFRINRNEITSNIIDRRIDAHIATKEWDKCTMRYVTIMQTYNGSKYGVSSLQFNDFGNGEILCKNVK